MNGNAIMSSEANTNKFDMKLVGRTTLRCMMELKTVTLKIQKITTLIVITFPHRQRKHQKDNAVQISLTLIPYKYRQPYHQTTSYDWTGTG